MRALAEMRMFRRIEMPAKGFNPVAGLAVEIDFLVVFTRIAAGIRRHVHFAALRTRIEDGRIIAAMEVGVCLRIDMFGEKPAAVAQSNRKQVSGFGAAASPTLKPRFKAGTQRYACCHAESQCQEKRTHAQFSAL